MCVFYDAHGVKHVLEKQFNVDPGQTELDLPGSYKMHPGKQAPVVVEDNGVRKLDIFEFGMMPSWAKKDEKNKRQWMYANARDDKLLSGRMWPPRFKQNRCLIPANGFFEPHKYPKKVNVAGGPKPTDSIPFYFHLKSQEVFAFAGIYDHWTDPESGEVLKSFSIITTGPNKIIKKIHNKKPRTPLILSPVDYGFWLGSVDKPDDYYEAGIFEPWPDDDMEAYQVTKQLDYGGEGPELIQPVEDPVEVGAGAADQGSLFG